MKNDKSYILYTITIVTVIFNLIMINVFLHPVKINDFLAKLGFNNTINQQSFTTLVMFILLFSIITCLLLVVSFISLMKKLISMNKSKI